MPSPFEAVRQDLADAMTQTLQNLRAEPAEIPGPGSWFGFLRDPVLATTSLIEREEYAAKAPERCRELGLVVCSCRGVDRDGDRVVIRDPRCRVHRQFDRLEERR